MKRCCTRPSWSQAILTALRLCTNDDKNIPHHFKVKHTWIKKATRCYRTALPLNQKEEVFPRLRVMTVDPIYGIDRL
jgi:hypothetical protein